MNLTIGRTVHYRIGGTDESPVLRPALVVNVWSDTCANLVVTFDGTNDSPAHHDPDGATSGILPSADEQARCSGWRTSITEGTAAGTWRWPARA